MKNQAMKFFLPILPKRKMSQMVGKFVSQEWAKPLSQLTVKSFADYFNIDMNEAEFPIEHYKSINDLFTRRLKVGVRPVGESTVVHPADGVVVESDFIRSQTLFQTKGLEYSVIDLVKENEWAQAVEGGVSMTTYLCPTDYHRVHSPVTGDIVFVKHIPGELWPVNGLYLKTFPKLFVTNERLVVGIQTPKGKAVVVMVGATNVGKMTLSFDPTVVTNRPSSRAVNDRFYNPSVGIKKGQELGIFHMGSTVIALYEKGLIGSDPLSLLGPVKMGQSIQ